MATLQPESEMTVAEMPQPAVEDLFSTDQNGECVTEEGLDWIWPIDDRTPVDIGGKGLTLPHTCVEFVPCYEKYGEQACLEFVFNGSKIPSVNANVPLGETGAFMLTAIAAIAVLKMRKYLA